MSQETVIYKKIDSVAEITLNPLQSKNEVIPQMAAEMSAVRDEISTDNDIRVIIIKGEWEAAFSEWDESVKLPLGANGTENMERLSIASLVGLFDLPTIAAINGQTAGQGLEVALACDLRICSETASFAMPQVTRGAIPWDGGTQRLPRLVGRAKAIEMILTGEVLEAQEAYRIGLVNRVVSPKELFGVVMEMAREMASKGPIALRYAKEAIHKGMDLTLDQGLRLEADLYFLLHTTRDRVGGIKAFRNKGKPDFEGR